MNTKYLLSTLLTFTLGSLSLHAGPPLICHPYEIGTAASLPAGEDHGVSDTYNRATLVPDTLALLTPEIPIIVRMETLRRAAIYASGGLRGFRNSGSYRDEDRKLAASLLQALRARTQDDAPGTQDLALFDLGFFAETLRQTGLDPTLDGYALLVKVAQKRPADADVQFALALATSRSERRDIHTTHLALAKSGAKPGTLLANNLQSHFGRE